MGNIIINNRMIGLDILKCICAFLVVCIHCKFTGILGIYASSIARIAVPIFFMVSGYFFESMYERNKVLKQIKKIVQLLIVACIIYYVWGFLKILIRQDDTSLLEYTVFVFDFQHLKNFILFNENYLRAHLWYLGAILYTLIIVYLARKNNFQKVLFFSIPLLLSMELILGKYSNLFLGMEYTIPMTRNFLFVGIPYFCIGNLIYLKRLQIGKWYLNNKQIMYSVLLGLFIISIIEIQYLNLSSWTSPGDYYLCTLFLSVTIFCIFIFEPLLNRKTKMTQCIAVFGVKFSTWVYILHPFVYDLSKILFQKYNAEIWNWGGRILPILVFVETIMILLIFSKLGNVIKTKVKLCRK